jgi:L-ascorbate metabolism protein UlaG (beta-lactamase superfamily)
VLRITWIGHSTVLIELDDVRLITDPVVRRRVIHLRRAAEPVEIATIGGVNVALISHLHHDHLDMRSLALLGRDVHVVAPSAGAAFLRGRGFAHVTGVDVGDHVRVRGVDVRATYAEHDGGRAPFLTGARSLGYVVTGSACVYFAGDTDLFAGMSALAPKLDAALLPVAGWGAHLPPGHLDPARAAHALALLRPRVAIPIHWGTYRRVGLARDPAVLRAPAEEFAQLAAELTPEVDVRLLPIGGSVELRAEDSGQEVELRA